MGSEQSPISLARSFARKHYPVFTAWRLLPPKYDGVASVYLGEVSLWREFDGNCRWGGRVPVPVAAGEAGENQGDRNQ